MDRQEQEIKGHIVSHISECLGQTNARTLFLLAFNHVVLQIHGGCTARILSVPHYGTPP